MYFVITSSRAKGLQLIEMQSYTASKASMPVSHLVKIPEDFIHAFVSPAGGQIPEKHLILVMLAQSQRTHLHVSLLIYLQLE